MEERSPPASMRAALGGGSRADAACVVALDAALADAAATALGNRVKDAGDIGAALEWAAGLPEILGAVVIVGDKLGARGQVELVPL